MGAQDGGDELERERRLLEDVERAVRLIQRLLERASWLSHDNELRAAMQVASAAMAAWRVKWRMVVGGEEDVQIQLPATITLHPQRGIRIETPAFTAEYGKDDTAAKMMQDIIEKLLSPPVLMWLAATVHEKFEEITKRAGASPNEG